MRVYQEKVLNAWAKGRAFNAPSMFTDGTDVYSYGYHFPLILKEDDGTLLVNENKYSRTTTSQQSAVAYFLRDYVEVEHGVRGPRGYNYVRYQKGS